jgi:hypothetical protein
MPPKDIFLAEKEVYPEDPVTKVVIIFSSPHMGIWLISSTMLSLKVTSQILGLSISKLSSMIFTNIL